MEAVMGSKKKKVETTDNTVDPFTQNMLNTAASNARAFGEQAYTPYTGERVADMSDMETQAMSNYMSNNVSNRGIMQQGLEMAQQGAQYTPDQIQTQNFTDMDISGYMNPYIQQVIDNTVSDIERKQIGSAENIDAQASKSAAFGGSRQAIQQAENERNYADITAKTIGQLRSQGYEDAAARLQADAARQLQADSYNQAAGLRGADLRLRGAEQVGNMAGQLSDADYRAYGIENQYGQTQRGLNQAQLDAQYQEAMRQYDDYYRRAGIEGGILGAAPTIVDGSTTTTESGGMGLGGLLTSTLSGIKIPGLPYK
jgi:hypothetical protein